MAGPCTDTAMRASAKYVLNNDGQIQIPSRTRCRKSAKPTAISSGLRWPRRFAPSKCWRRTGHNWLLKNSELRELQRSATDGKYLDVNRLLEAQRYELLLKAQSQELAKQAILLAAETERRRQMLVEADREVRVLELLDERHRRCASTRCTTSGDETAG